MSKLQIGEREEMGVERSDYGADGLDEEEKSCVCQR